MAISLQILALPHISWFYPHSLLSYLSHPFVDKILMLSSMPKNAPQKKTWSICDRPQTKKTLIWLVMVIFHWNSKKKTGLNCPSSLIVGLGARSFCTASVRIWYALFPPGAAIAVMSNGKVRMATLRWKTLGVMIQRMEWGKIGWWICWGT